LEYCAPEREANFLLFELFRVQDIWPNIAGFDEFTQDLVEAIIGEAARLSAEVLTPTNQIGDQEGCTWDKGDVTTPAAFKGAFAELTAGGWLGLAGNPEYGGQGMPKMLACLVEEMFWSSNTSLCL